MDNLFRLINEKHYVGYYLPYNSVGEIADSILEGPFGLKDKYHAKQSFDGKHYIFTFDKSVNGNKEEFEKNFANPLCDVSVYRSTLVVEENEDKICLKVFYCGKNRRAGEVFYRKSTRLNYITFNKKTNIFTVGKNTEYHKKRGKGKSTVVRRNSFPISLTTEGYSSFMNGLDNGKTTESEVLNGINVFLSEIGAELIETLNKLPLSLFGCLLEKQGIKKPDNWRGYYEVYPKPTKKDYNKNGFKMVDTYMKLHDVSSEKIKKVLHKIQNPCFTSIKNLISVFGKDFILQRPEKELSIIFNTTSDESPFITEFTRSFKKRDLFSCYQIYLLSKIDPNLSVHTFYDHIRFFNTLSRYEPVRWNSKTLKEFNAEHILWSDKADFYTRGRYNRYYSNEFVEKVSKPIELKDGRVFTPVVLQKSEEYVDESVNQSNCVRTYQNRAESLIISLRNEQEERASIEYLPSFIGKIYNNKDMSSVVFDRGQTLGKFNQPLNNSWDDAIFQLDDRLKTINKKMWGNPIAEFVTGGSKKEYEFLFHDNGRLCWTNSDDSIDIGDELPYIDFEW